MIIIINPEQQLDIADNQQMIQWLQFMMQMQMFNEQVRHSHEALTFGRRADNSQQFEGGGMSFLKGMSEG